MAHKSLALKLKARSDKKQNSENIFKNSSSADNLLHLISNVDANETVHPNFENAEMKMVDYSDNQITEQKAKYQYKKRRHLYLEDTEYQSETENVENSLSKTTKISALNKNEDYRVDKVYTIGCFDLFHYGHVQLINRMRELGKKVIVGVHDSRRYIN